MEIRIIEGSKSKLMEFNSFGNKKTFKPHHVESLYIEKDIFDLMIRCYVADRIEYNIYGPIRLNNDKLRHSAEKLGIILVELTRVKNRNTFVTIFKKYDDDDNLFKEYLDNNDENWRNNWEALKDKLEMIINEILNVIEKCLNNNQTLWIAEV